MARRNALFPLLHARWRRHARSISNAQKGVAASGITLWPPLAPSDSVEDAATPYEPPLIATEEEKKGRKRKRTTTKPFPREKWQCVAVMQNAAAPAAPAAAPVALAPSDLSDGGNGKVNAPQAFHEKRNKKNRVPQ